MPLETSRLIRWRLLHRSQKMFATHVGLKWAVSERICLVLLGRLCISDRNPASFLVCPWTHRPIGHDFCLSSLGFHNVLCGVNSLVTLTKAAGDWSQQWATLSKFSLGLCCGPVDTTPDGGVVDHGRELQVETRSEPEVSCSFATFWTAWSLFVFW